MSVQRFWTQNNLSIIILAIFVVSLGLMSITGWQTENNERQDHSLTPQSYGDYVASGAFIEGVFENWESEFLQMFALVVLTIYLRQKGSADSKPLRGTTPVDTTSRYSIIRSSSLKDKTRAVRHGIYSHSLSLSLAALFILSFCLHAIGGSENYNEEAKLHGGDITTPVTYVRTSQFWYESFQNWQSEFLAVGSLLILSIHFRERGSPESKPVGKSYSHTTGE